MLILIKDFLMLTLTTFEMEYLVYTSYNMTKELEIHFDKNDLNNKETKK